MTPFRTHNSLRSINTDGTHLLGRVIASVGQLRAVFGEPMFNIACKTAEEWSIRFADSKVATVYRPIGDTPTPRHVMPHQQTVWSIGGKDVAVVQRIWEWVHGEHHQQEERQAFLEE